nr:hypothetical protein [Pandoravirus belohorizontensis]
MDSITSAHTTGASAASVHGQPSASPAAACRRRRGCARLERPPPCAVVSSLPSTPITGSRLRLVPADASVDYSVKPLRTATAAGPGVVGLTVAIRKSIKNFFRG